MATAAHAVPSLDIDAPPDAMDLHSDSGLDFGDEDIELDLEPTNAFHHQDDDDLSLRDAGTDGGLDVQTAPADNDDFMADNDDLIVEDEIDYHDEEVIDAAQSLHDSSGVQQENVVPDDDLIDYSDEEDLPHDDSDLVTVTHPPEPHTEQLERNETGTEQQLPSAPRSEAHNSITNTQLTPKDSPANDGTGQEFGRSADQFTQEEPREDWEHITTGYQNDAKENGHNHGNNLQESEYDLYANGEEGQDDQALLESHSTNAYEELSGVHDVGDDTTNDVNDSSHSSEHNQANVPSDSHPVTVNYDGSELWLFKSNDSEGSGDWLLEDDSLIQQPICHLFQACRQSLGEDVTDEIELGVRFDHLHNMELYEDNTVCVCTNLAQMVDLYHKLHAQDGNSNPECFYITLQFRPRFSTLLGEIRKAVEEGIGHSGLDKVISAGQTSFNAFHSNASTEHNFDNWREDEQDLDQKSSKGTDSYNDKHEEDEQNGHEQAYDEDHYEEDVDAATAQAEQDPLQEGLSQEVPINHTPQQDQHHPTDDELAKTEFSAEPTTTSPHIEGIQTPELQENEEELIDYSDDEGLAETTVNKETVASQLSSSSSTVQGDDNHTNEHGVEDLTNSTEPVGPDGQDQFNYDYSVENGDAPNYVDGNDLGEHPNDPSYGDETLQQYDQEYDQPKADQDVEAQQYIHQDNEESGEYFNDNVDHYDNPEQDEFALTIGVDDDENHFEDPANIGSEYADVGDFLNLDHADENTAFEGTHTLDAEDAASQLPDEDEVDYDNDDGADEQGSATASSVANPVAASSTELQELSPQGQKRSIDEVGSGVREVADSIDAKRLKL